MISRRSTLLGAFASAGAARLAFGQDLFRGLRPGQEREIDGLTFCWCPAGRFIMGSPRNEPERRPGEDQVEVTLTRGFWMAKHEATHGFRVVVVQKEIV